MLYRIDGSSAVSDAERACFDDIADSYYTDAVAWAYSNGIVNGVSADRFEPDRIVTRQEAVTIFYRYCVDYNLMSVESGLELEGFADQDEVAGFATDAFAWAVSTGLVAGSADTDGADGIQPIRVLSAFSLQSGWNNRILSGIGYFPDNPADPVNRVTIHLIFFQKTTGICFCCTCFG